MWELLVMTAALVASFVLVAAGQAVGDVAGLGGSLALVLGAVAFTWVRRGWMRGMFALAIGLAMLAGIIWELRATF